MRYIFFICENDKFWIEMNDKNFATRQIILSDGRYRVSALEDCLAEGMIIEEEIGEDIITISVEEFEHVWSEALIEYRKNWDSIKIKNKINHYITAEMAYFYPQGAIFRTNDMIIVYVGEDAVQLHEKKKMKIIGYDDVNMWIIAQ